jgi:hypothetical protein
MPFLNLPGTLCEALCAAALDASEQLMMRSPNTNSQLLPFVEALVAGLLHAQVTGEPKSSLFPIQKYW